jgi:alpha-galactosidase
MIATRLRRASLLALLVPGVLVGSCSTKGSSNDGAAGSMTAGAGGAGAGALTAGGTSSTDVAGAQAGGAGKTCEDVYPFTDGFTCAQQAGFGKCNESWLLGFCNMSCNRCGEGAGGAAPTFGGPRNVFETYTPVEPLAPTPPMGWNSWNKFACNIDETLIKETADALVSSGMKDVGYQYVNIDDCWQAKARDSEGNLVADPLRFPGGIAALAEYVHDLGLKLGIYSDRGTKTCAGFPGSFDHEQQDAAIFAEWGIDYLKYDNCAIPLGREGGAEMQEDYAIMGEALRQAGRPIVYSISAWWFYPWMPDVAHLWRTTTDIQDSWATNKHSVTSLLNWSGGDTARYGIFAETDLGSGAYAAPGLASYAGPHHWNDPDMLEVGNGGMTDIEYRSHFSLWALMAAPLITGTDLRTMTAATTEILLNTEVIAVNQDPLGVQGTPVSESTTLEVWSKKLEGTDTYAVVLLNRTEAAADITVTWSSLGLTATSATASDLWQHTDLGVIADEYTATVPSHGVAMLKVTGQ